MEQLLQGIAHVTVYIDDILIATESEDEHLQILEEVFARLAKADLKVKKHKCKFMVRSVPYLGHCQRRSKQSGRLLLPRMLLN